MIPFDKIVEHGDHIIEVVGILISEDDKFVTIVNEIRNHLYQEENKRVVPEVSFFKIFKKAIIERKRIGVLKNDE